MRVCPDIINRVDGEGGFEDGEAFPVGDGGDAALAHGTAFPVMPAAASSPDLKPSWKRFEHMQAGGRRYIDKKKDKKR